MCSSSSPPRPSLRVRRSPCPAASAKGSARAGSGAPPAAGLGRKALKQPGRRRCRSAARRSRRPPVLSAATRSSSPSCSGERDHSRRCGSAGRRQAAAALVLAVGLAVDAALDSGSSQSARGGASTPPRRRPPEPRLTCGCPTARASPTAGAVVKRKGPARRRVSVRSSRLRCGACCSGFPRASSQRPQVKRAASTRPGPHSL